MYSSLRADQRVRVVLTFLILILLGNMVGVMVLFVWMDWPVLLSPLFGGCIGWPCYRLTEHIYGIDRP